MKKTKKIKEIKEPTLSKQVPNEVRRESIQFIRQTLQDRIPAPYQRPNFLSYDEMREKVRMRIGKRIYDDYKHLLSPWIRIYMKYLIACATDTNRTGRPDEQKLKYSRLASGNTPINTIGVILQTKYLIHQKEKTADWFSTPEGQIGTDERYADLLNQIESQIQKTGLFELYTMINKYSLREDELFKRTEDAKTAFGQLRIKFEIVDGQPIFEADPDLIKNVSRLYTALERIEKLLEKDVLTNKQKKLAEFFSEKIDMGNMKDLQNDPEKLKELEDQVKIITD